MVGRRVFPESAYLYNLCLAQIPRKSVKNNILVSLFHCSFMSLSLFVIKLKPLPGLQPPGSPLWVAIFWDHIAFSTDFTIFFLPMFPFSEPTAPPCPVLSRRSSWAMPIPSSGSCMEIFLNTGCRLFNIAYLSTTPRFSCALHWHLAAGYPLLAG